MSAEGYEQEQEQLRRQFEGNPEDLKIDVPRAPQVNPEIFRDVEPLLFRGFIYQVANVNGVPFVFKSLNHHEFEYLSFIFLDSGSTKAVIRKNYSRFLAHTVLMVDGVNILPNRDEWISEIADTFDNLSDKAREKIIFQVSEINRRASQATFLVEVFSMEASSRLRWAQMKGLDLTSTAITGLAGTQSLGLNYGQLMWRALNHIEDRRMGEEADWENAKLVASAMAGKGMQKLQSQDKRRKEQEHDARMERRDKILRFAIFGEDPEGEKKDGTVVTVARTVDELASQLERDLRGEKDWHDQVVEAYERRVQEAYLERSRQIEKLREDHRAKYGDKAMVIGETEIRKGLTPGEVQDRIKQRREATAKRLASSSQKYAAFMDPNKANFAEKWIKPGLNDVVRDESQAIPAVLTHRQPGKPFNRGDV